MLNGDIGTFQTFIPVVVFEGVLAEPPPSSRFFRVRGRKARPQGIVEAELRAWNFHLFPIGEMAIQSFHHNFLYDIWTFLPRDEYEGLLERRLNEKGIPFRNLVFWDSVDDAAADLETSPGIRWLFDSDYKRCKVWPDRVLYRTQPGGSIRIIG